MPRSDSAVGQEEHPSCSNPQWGWHPLCRPEAPLLGVHTAVRLCTAGPGGCSPGHGPGVRLLRGKEQIGLICTAVLPREPCPSPLF